MAVTVREGRGEDAERVLDDPEMPRRNGEKIIAELRVALEAHHPAAEHLCLPRSGRKRWPRRRRGLSASAWLEQIASPRGRLSCARDGLAPTVWCRAHQMDQGGAQMLFNLMDR